MSASYKFLSPMYKIVDKFKSFSNLETVEIVGPGIRVQLEDAENNGMNA